MTARGDVTTREGTHEEALLIPWYCNGTLAREERERVEIHLGSCASCRADVELWRRVGEEVSAPAAPPVPHPAQLRRLLERAGANVDDSGEPASGRPLPARGPVPSRLPARWRLVLVGQAAALVALLAWTAIPRGAGTPAPYRTLAAPAVEPAGWRLHAVFAEQTSEKELRALLVSLGARLVDGPSPLGVYTVEVPATLDPASTVAVLRTRPEVRFVEPAPSPDSPTR